MPDLLPINATPQERALSLATDRLPDAPIKTLWSPQTCPAAQLPWLAWALSVDEWDSAWPEETKRNVIAASIEQHRRKGTVGALRRALQRLGYEVEIDERTGTAYTFRLRFKVRNGESSAGAVLDQAVTKATAVALRQKNARSELLDIALLGEGGTAGIYSGGAPISGAEVEIKDPDTSITAKPLDAYELAILGSFWTTRMHSNYKGPIGRVQRNSDGAWLNYFTVAELRAFDDGGGFKYWRLYSQRGSGQAIAYNTHAAGDWDANGLPVMKMRFGGTIGDSVLTFQFRKRSVANLTMMVAVDRQTVTGVSVEFGSEDYNPSRLSYIGGSLWNSGVLDQIENGNIIGTPPSVASAGAGQSCIIGRLNATNRIVLTTDGTDTQPTGWETSLANRARLFTDQNNPCYGFTIWNRDVGASDAADIITAVETELQF